MISRICMYMRLVQTLPLTYESLERCHTWASNSKRTFMFFSISTIMRQWTKLLHTSVHQRMKFKEQKKNMTCSIEFQALWIWPCIYLLFFHVPPTKIRVALSKTFSLTLLVAGRDTKNMHKPDFFLVLTIKKHAARKNVFFAYFNLFWGDWDRVQDPEIKIQSVSVLLC